MNPAAVDHIAFATADLASAVDALEKRLGVRATPGGQHLGMGTRNFLLSLGEACYLEIIGPDPAQPEPENGRPFGIDGMGAGRLSAFAVRPDDLEKRCTAARAAGYDPGSILEMSRETPEGGRIDWRLTLWNPTAGDGRAGVVGIVIQIVD